MRNLITILFYLIATLSHAEKGLLLTQKYSTSTEGQNIITTWYLTETKCKLKMQFSDNDVNTTNYFIPDLKSNKLLVYSDGATPEGVQPIYYSLPVQNIKSDIEVLTVDRTGETKQISGFACEKVIAKGKNSITEMWVTKDFKSDYSRFASFFKSSYELKALSQGGLKGFPLVSTTKDSNGTVVSSYDLVSVSTTEISENEFKIPAEYKSADELGKQKK